MRVPESSHVRCGPRRVLQLTYRSKCARRRFSTANQTMRPRANHMIQPVTPGPVAKLSTRNPTTPLFGQPNLLAGVNGYVTSSERLPRGPVGLSFCSSGFEKGVSLRSYAYVRLYGRRRKRQWPMLLVLPDQLSYLCLESRENSLWNEMFLSNGMIELSGVRRRSEMKFRHTGKRMKITSTGSSARLS